MEFLYFLEGLRNPFLDAVMQLITRIGEETAFMAVAVFFLWCVDKYKGYYLLMVGFLGTQINQLLKVSFRIERPWVLDPEFTVVQSAVPEATGYSFPSGHTQSAVGTFGGVARCVKRRWIRIACIAVCLLVPLSRMYLGVHTLADTITSVVIALVLVFSFYPLIARASARPKVMWILLAAIVAWSSIERLRCRMPMPPHSTNRATSTPATPSAVPCSSVSRASSSSATAPPRSRRSKTARSPRRVRCVASSWRPSPALSTVWWHNACCP